MPCRRPGAGARGRRRTPHAAFMSSRRALCRPHRWTCRALSTKCPPTLNQSGVTGVQWREGTRRASPSSAAVRGRSIPDLGSAGRPKSHHAMPPTTLPKIRMASHVWRGRVRISGSGVFAKSIGQYAQKSRTGSSAAASTQSATSAVSAPNSCRQPPLASRHPHMPRRAHPSPASHRFSSRDKSHNGCTRPLPEIDEPCAWQDSCHRDRVFRGCGGLTCCFVSFRVDFSAIQYDN